MSELREAAQAALEQWDKASDVYSMTSAVDRLRAVLAQPKTELRDQHKAFAEWFLQQNPIAPNVEDMAWAAWKAALAQPETEAEPVAWQARHIGRGEPFQPWWTVSDESVQHVREQDDFEMRPLYAHPPRAAADERERCKKACEAVAEQVTYQRDSQGAVEKCIAAIDALGVDRP